MKAWIVRDDYEGNATIIFNNHGLAARRLGASELDLDFEQVECDRAKHFDKFSDAGHVPMEILIKEHGWWFSCWNCSGSINEDMDEFEKAIYGKNAVYCSNECRIQRINEIDKINKEYEEFQISILNCWTQYDIVKFSGGYPCLTPSAYFTFPGAKHLGLLRIINPINGHIELICHVAYEDQENYYKMIQERSLFF